MPSAFTSKCKHMLILPPVHSVPAPCLAPLASSVGGGGEVGLASAAITQQAGKHSHLSGKAMRRGVHRIHIRNLGALQLLFAVQECWHIWQLLGSRLHEEGAGL